MKNKKKPTKKSQTNQQLQTAIALHQAGKLDAAEALYKSLLASLPNHPQLLENLGICLFQQGKVNDGLKLINQSLAINPKQPFALYNLGNALIELKRYDEAITNLQKAIVLKPNYLEACFKLGNLFLDLNQLDDAIANYRQAIKIKPDFAEAYSNLGMSLQKNNQFQEALINYDQAIKYQPNLSESHSNRGAVLQILNRPNEAISNYEQAIALKPDYAAAYSNCGVSLQSLHRIDEAITRYDQAIAISPDYAEAYWNKALIKLLIGNFIDGWQLYEWGWKCGNRGQLRHSATSLWLGKSSLIAKTLLIHPEQGFGDWVQFIRYADLAAKAGAKVILEVHQPLLALAASLKGNFTLVESGQPLPNFDLHCPIMSLPLAFKTTLETIPNNVPYLFADPERQAIWQQRLGPKTQPRVCLVWSGSSTHYNDHNRSLNFAALQPLLSLPFKFHCLQKDIRPDDEALVAACNNLICHKTELTDFAETAALIAEMDWVISVDTAVAHLAGAMNKPVWILLPFAPDFRWLLDRTDSPWYPSARLFRQSKIGDWSEVLETVAAELVNSIKLPASSQTVTPEVTLQTSPVTQEQNQLLQKALDLHQSGNLEQAIANYNQLIYLYPDFAEAYCNLGLALQKLNKPNEAITQYEKAIEHKPDLAAAYFNLGVSLQIVNRLNDAITSYEQAIKLRPDYPAAYANRGVALKNLKEFNKAIDSFNHAIKLKSDYAEAYCNRGVAFQELKQLDDAIANYEKAISINPNLAEAYSNRGMGFQALKQFEKAIANYEKAIAINPNFAEAYLNKSLAKLTNGEFLEGWQLYEWRWKTNNKKNEAREYHQPHWLGETPLTNKTLLIYPEQGYGDYIQSLRYASLAEQAGAKVILELPQALMALAASLKGNFTLVESGQPLPNFDLHCPIMSLPLAFKTTLETIPNELPYLFAAPERQAIWQQPLGEKTQPRIGLVWSGSSTHGNDHNRSLNFAALQPLLSLPFEFHCLQKEIRPDDAALVKACDNLICHQTELTDFAETAALIAEMDWVISVDTAVAHLAGAMNKPVWILLPFAPDFRWLLDRTDSPWYPSAKLFRQSKLGDWANVLDEITKELKQLNAFPIPKINKQTLNSKIKHLNLNDPSIEISAEKFFNSGVNCQNHNQLNQAVKYYQQAIDLKDDYFEAYSNLAVVLKKLNRNTESLAGFAQAIRINSNCAELFYNYGVAFQELNQLDEAINNFNQAIKLNPSDVDAYWNKSLVLLLMGHYTQGWPMYEWRWKNPALNKQARPFKQPLWLGETPLTIKTLLIYPEQGLGDYIQCLRYASLAEQAGAKVILELPAALIDLAATLKGNFTLVECGQPLPNFDLHCPIMSLPLAFKTTLKTIPNNVPYLFADPVKQAIWQQRLGEKSQPRIGLVWSGSTMHVNDHNRSIAFKALQPLLNLPFEFHCLQKEIRPEDAALVATCDNLICHETELTDFAETAALIAEMDWVISVDTSVAHLAGAMNKPVWILLPFAPDFRWLLDRTDSPWYPSARLFRQTKIGDWTKVITKVKKAALLAKPENLAQGARRD